MVSLLAELLGYFEQWTGHDSHDSSYKGEDLANGGLYSCEAQHEFAVVFPQCFE